MPTTSNVKVRVAKISLEHTFVSMTFRVCVFGRTMICATLKGRAISAARFD